MRSALPRLNEARQPARGHMHTSRSLEVSARIAAFAAQYPDPSWYVALVAAGFQRTGDVDQAIRFADEAITRFPTPGSLPHIGQ